MHGIKNTLMSMCLILFTMAISYNGQSQAAVKGEWSKLYAFRDVVPAAAANLPNGNILVWSAWDDNEYRTAENAQKKNQTTTGIFNPTTGKFTPRLVTTAGHDMFCPGTANLPDGRILITGGSTNPKTTFYNPTNNTWSSGRDLNSNRGYHSQVTMSDGRNFTIGGSWSGGRKDRVAEIWSEETGWMTLPGILSSNSIAKVAVEQNAPANKPDDYYRTDNHAWLFAAPNGEIFHAGPGKKMHFFETEGQGKVRNVGNRGNSKYSMNGNATMFDIGKILVSGGAISYALGEDATNKAYVIDINNPNNVTVTQSNSMEKKRTYHNSVVLPNGQVVVTGGLEIAKIFSDINAPQEVEIFTPNPNNALKGTWQTGAASKRPRTYHSVSILMQDGRVFSGGGGLCGESCPPGGENHPNAEIYSPPYLFNANGTLAARPKIDSSANSMPYSLKSFTLNTQTNNENITSAALVRMSSVTHSVNLEQRRIPLNITSTQGKKVTINVNKVTAENAPPGNYFLFIMNDKGVPSVAKVIKVGATTELDEIIPDGKTFYIQGAGGVRVSGPTDNGNDVVMLASDKKAETKQWKFNHLGGNVYTIRNIATNRYMESKGVSACKDGNNVVTFSNFIPNNDNAKWHITQVGANFFFRPLSCRSQALDINTVSNGVQSARLMPFSTGNNMQKFKLKDVETNINLRSAFEGSTFDATPRAGQHAELSWTYDQTKEVDEYIVEYSYDIDVEFTPVESISATSDEGNQTYNYTHEEALIGDNYYRVKVIFMDGTTDYLTTRMVPFSEAPAPISLSPNPTQDRLYFDLANYMNVEVSYYILDATGRGIKSGIFNESHADKEMLDLSEYGSGKYIIVMHPNNAAQISQQFILMGN